MVAKNKMISEIVKVLPNNDVDVLEVSVSAKTVGIPKEEWVSHNLTGEKEIKIRLVNKNTQSKFKEMNLI
ncbi:hypothetical protein [Sutcliffiella halmapala]|uniref:hypothetical protein n=1 Tax=Sutcliffiella halmapala TaxID=79882 RepID=UPI000994A428|nr:hypothetical protein [Sutcliffiella halmapala]